MDFAFRVGIALLAGVYSIVLVDLSLDCNSLPFLGLFLSWIALWPDCGRGVALLCSASLSHTSYVRLLK